ncbi:tyrosine/serine/threonine protein phosphatase [Pleurotus ostreatus]|nr:tyrosine/serine/threonine protein phosphatase [Pleurotus ostreatus]
MPQPMPHPQKQRKRPPSTLRIDTPAQNPHIAHVVQDSLTSASATDSAASDYFSSPFNSMSRSSRNKLSLTLSSARSSTNSLTLDRSDEPPPTADPVNRPIRPRRPSVISLPPPTNPTSLLQRREEEEGSPGSPTAPYRDGPIQIIPNIWLGSEDNARDWKTLHTLGIKCILNVAKEISSPFESVASGAPRPLRPVASTPNLGHKDETKGTYYPPHVPSGRPGIHYLKLQWSHGQQNLVEEGFPAAMLFCDAALERGEGVLIHCQCGISRSATMVIALVMRAAAENSPLVPPEIWELKGMQGAYSFVKEKSKWVGPNMSLIYQLIEYERKLKGNLSPASSERSSAIAEEEEEWGRRRKLLDEAEEGGKGASEEQQESKAVLAEAQALDRAMEERIIARRSSASSLASNSSLNGFGNGVGMGQAWRSRYATTRKRTGSIASNHTNYSILSEELVEEDEEQALLGVGGGFDDDRPRLSIASSTDSSNTSATSATSSADHSPDDESNPPARKPSMDDVFTPSTARPLSSRPAFPLPPPSAPVWKTSFGSSTYGVPQTSTRATFDLPVDPFTSQDLSQAMSTTPKATKPTKMRRRPVPLGLNILPPVPSSPITIVADESDSGAESSARASQSSSVDALSEASTSVPRGQPSTQTSLPIVPLRVRTQSRKPLPPPLHLRNATPPKTICTARPMESLRQSHHRNSSLSLSSTSSSSSFSSHSSGATHSRHPSSSSIQDMLSRPHMQPRGASQPIQPHTPRRPTLPRSQSSLNTPSQTLFVFPPSPTLNARTPSTMTLTMSGPTNPDPHPDLATAVPFPTLSTPRVETFKGKHGRTRSFIGLGAPPTPTTACSRVDAKGWVAYS